MRSSPVPKTSILASGGGAMLMDPADTVILLLDHQSGLFQTVKDIPVADLRRNVEMIARLASLLQIPVITTASEPAGSNGPLIPEIALHAPHAVYVPRKGGVKPTSPNAPLSELHRTWVRPEAGKLAMLYGLAAPNHAAVIESYVRARQAPRAAAV
ncbi:hypothetical protein [Sphingomonas azotifigens]|uniref:hypothetical protein n=1 Tax=Sphingomonas azotifigens TaxID=330920 RepID=UPI000A045DA1|nr:hypothetical protein [Sphingomonas azotifigens]